MYHMKRTDHPLVKQVCAIAHPDYTGQAVKIEYTTRPLDLRSYWSGGSRTSWVLVKLVDMSILPIPPQSMFDRQIAGAEAFVLPEGVVAVAHVYSCGADLGLTIYARDDGVKFLPAAPVGLSDDEKLVLRATRGLKSSYAGISDYRKHELTAPRHWSADSAPLMTGARVDAARMALQAKGLLDKRNAITNAGKNAIEGEPFWQ